MKASALLLSVLIVGSAQAEDGPIAKKMVECEGTTVITVDSRIGAQAPFHAVFDIDGDTVKMLPGETDTTVFAETYTLHPELQRPDRPGYHSEKGNLFFYKQTGRFEIFKMDVVSSGIKKVTTTGQCKPFTPSSVF
jgi:hypothetical protein